MVIPYVDGVSQQIRRVCSKFNVKTYFKPHKTLKQLLVRPKDTINAVEKPGPIYKMQCDGCPKVYIGESKRNVKVRQQEHQKSVKKLNSGNIDPQTSEATAEHSYDTGHTIKWENTSVIGFEAKRKQREIKEAIYIQASTEEKMNRNVGKYTIYQGWIDLLKKDVNKK